MKNKREFFIALLLVLLSIPLASGSCALPDLDAFHELCQGGSVEEVRSAIGQMKNINAKGEGGMTALMWAANWNPDPEVVSILLQAGADINAKDQDGMTALMYASGWNQEPEVAIRLVQAGADLDARDQDGMTALMWAALDSQYPEVVIALLEAGADAGARSAEGETAFDLIRQNPDLDGTEAYMQLKRISK